MREQIELFLTALGFFTRIPAAAQLPWSPERLNNSARYFPLVGWVVGGAGAALLWLLLHWLPAGVAVLLSMAATIRLTGAFHEDGFADACDGLGGGWQRAQVLELMKDSRLGNYGAIGLTLMLLAKAAALTELAGQAPAHAMLALLVAHPLSRLASTALIHRLEYVREDLTAKSKPLARALRTPELLIAAAGGLLPLALLPLRPALAALLLAALATWWFARLLLRRLCGYTGDCLGAAQQLSELACYLALLAAWTSS